MDHRTREVRYRSKPETELEARKRRCDTVGSPHTGASTVRE